MKLKRLSLNGDIIMNNEGYLKVLIKVSSSNEAVEKLVSFILKEYNMVCSIHFDLYHIFGVIANALNESCDT